MPKNNIGMDVDQEVRIKTWDGLDIPRGMLLNSHERISVQFRIEMKLIRKLMETVHKVVGFTAKMTVDQDEGLSMRAMNSDSVALCELKIDTSGIYDFICEERTTFNLNMKDFLQALLFLDSGRSSTYLWFQAAGDTPEMLYIRRVDPTYAWVDMHLRDSDIDQNPPKMRVNLENPACLVCINAEDVNRIMEYLDDFGDTVKISIDDDKMAIAVDEKDVGAVYEVYSRESRLNQGNPKIRIDAKTPISNQLFSLAYLKLFVKAFNVSKVAEFRFSDVRNGVLRVKYEVCHLEAHNAGSSYLSFTIATKISSDPLN